MRRYTSPPLGRVVVTALLLATVGCAKTVEDATEHKLVLEPRKAVEWPGPPTTVRLVLQLEGNRLRVVSATPKRGTVREPSLADNQQALFDGHVRLVEYVARDGGGVVLSTGLFLVRGTAVAEFQDLEIATRVRRQEESLPNPVVRVSIPYDARIATVAFEGLQPEAEVDPRKWKRVSLGQVRLDLRGDRGQQEETSHD